MMNRQRECEEIVTDKDAGKSYRFAGTFNFIRMLSLAGRDPSFIFADLADGLLPPDEIKNVIKFAIEELNGEIVADEDREAIAIEFIERAGLTDASLIARIMMSHAMVGTIKKKQLLQQEAIQAIFKSSHSRWRIFASIGLLWVGSLAVGITGSTALLCMIFR